MASRAASLAQATKEFLFKKLYVPESHLLSLIIDKAAGGFRDLGKRVKVFLKHEAMVFTGGARRLECFVSFISGYWALISKCCEVDDSSPNKGGHERVRESKTHSMPTS